VPFLARFSPLRKWYLQLRVKAEAEDRRPNGKTLLVVDDDEATRHRRHRLKSLPSRFDLDPD
jgi:hypothetical protein